MTEKEYKKLVKLADDADRRGEFDEADMIDSKIQEARLDENSRQEIELEIPEEERKVLEGVLESLRLSLE
jgi:hypothetical protein